MLSNVQQREYMERAIAEAERALEFGNYPIGALIVNGDGTVMATEMNRYGTDGDITAHAEILAIRKLGHTVDKHAPGEFYLFSSLEPCFGCSFFLARTNIRHIVSALKDPHKGGISDLAGQEQFRKFFEGIETVNDPFPDLAARSKKLLYTYFQNLGRETTAAYYK